MNLCEMPEHMVVSDSFSLTPLGCLVNVITSLNSHRTYMLLERDQRENLNENNRKYKHLNKCFPVSLKQFLWHNIILQPECARLLRG